MEIPGEQTSSFHYQLPGIFVGNYSHCVGGNSVLGSTERMVYVLKYVLLVKLLIIYHRSELVVSVYF